MTSVKTLTNALKNSTLDLPSKKTVNPVTTDPTKTPSDTRTVLMNPSAIKAI